MPKILKSPSKKKTIKKKKVATASQKPNKTTDIKLKVLFLKISSENLNTTIKAITTNI